MQSREIDRISIYLPAPHDAPCSVSDLEPSPLHKFFVHLTRPHLLPFISRHAHLYLPYFQLPSFVLCFCLMVYFEVVKDLLPSYLEFRAAVASVF
jgi:hypothetical protein